MSQRPPVKDWATDFDHLDQRWVNDPFPIWDDMRKRCPIAHTDRFMGVYLPTVEEWRRAFADGGWVCREEYAITAPPNGYFFSLTPDRA